MKAGVITALLVLSVALHTHAAGPSTAPAGKAVIIELRGEVDDYNRDKLFRRFDEARKLGAQVVILDVDSYGGMVTSGLEISRFIKRQNDLHTIAYVQDKAISAGAMIAMACDEIIVGPSIELGDCAPIIYSEHGLESLAPAERAKMETPILVDFQESAQRNHHDPLLARAMVNVETVVHWVQNDQGERRFVNEEDYKKLTGEGWKPVTGAPDPIDSDKTLLTVDAQQAKQYRIAVGSADSPDELASQRGYTLVGDLRPGTGEKVVEFLGSTLMRGILLVIFLQCLYIIVHAPGHGVAEVLGLVALGLMLGVPLLTGYAQWWEILLIFIGLGLVAFEMLLPGHFVPGITGGILVLGGLVLTFVPFGPGGMPGSFGMASTWHGLERGLLVIASALICSMFLWAWLNRYLPKIPYFKGLILTTTSGAAAPVASAGRPEAVSSVWPPIGSIGRAVTDLRPGGSAEFFDPTIADSRPAAVVSDSGYVLKGAKLEVREVGGTRIVVRPVVEL